MGGVFVPGAARSARPRSSPPPNTPPAALRDPGGSVGPGPRRPPPDRIRSLAGPGGIAASPDGSPGSQTDPGRSEFAVMNPAPDRFLDGRGGGGFRLTARKPCGDRGSRLAARVVILCRRGVRARRRRSGRPHVPEDRDIERGVARVAGTAIVVRDVAAETGPGTCQGLAAGDRLPALGRFERMRDGRCDSSRYSTITRAWASARLVAISAKPAAPEH